MYNYEHNVCKQDDKFVNLQQISTQQTYHPTVCLGHPAPVRSASLTVI